jgi:thiosulfate reductase cytochrome b subunit
MAPQNQTMPQPTAQSPTRSSLVPVPPALRLVEKHPAAIRWMHWLNFPLLFLMIVSGLMIYWADSIPGQGGKHQVYRIGFGSFTLIRLFPDNFYRLFRLSHHFPQGLGLHALGMWFFAANGIAYVLFLGFSGQWRHIIPDREALARLLATLRAELTGSHLPHAGQKYNPVQRLAYTLVLLMGAGAVLTGAAIWKPTSLHLITTLCGGYQTARWLHFWLTLGFCLFFVVHVAHVFRAGWNNLRSMIAGFEVAAFEVAETDINSVEVVPVATKRPIP